MSYANLNRYGADWLGEKWKLEVTRWNGGSSFEQTFKNLDNVLWKEAGCTTELDYTEQSSWMLFLKYQLERERALKDELDPTNSSSIRIIAGPSGPRLRRPTVHSITTRHSRATT